MKRCFALLTGLAFCSLPARADDQVARSGADLELKLGQTAPGTWELQDSEGHFCAKGNLTGQNDQVTVAHLAPDVDLQLLLKNGKGELQRTVKVAGQRSLSTLGKLGHDAVIYQLPPRTYFATGLGKDHTGKLSDLSAQVLADIKDFGADYVYVTGVPRAASADDTDVDVVKGDAGSFFAIDDAWDVNPQLGSLADFKAAVDRAHSAGLRVMMDLVVNHTARRHRTMVGCKGDLDFGAADDKNQFFSSKNDYFYIQGATFVPPLQNGKAGADGVYDTDIFTAGLQLEAPARVTGNNVVSATPKIDDWFETAKLNYGYDFTTKTTHYTPRPHSWEQVVDVAKFWLDQGVDGFRIDMAHAVPVEFWQYFAAQVRAVQPNVFLLAEAYEQDQMRAPSFTYEALYQAGIDSIFNSDLYHQFLDQGQVPGRMYNVLLSQTPALRPDILAGGYTFTNYLENHDEVRLASSFFAPHLADQDSRATFGLALATYGALMPAHFFVHGGQELAEDASVSGPFGGDSGRTSIFDFVYQGEVRAWLAGDRSPARVAFRNRYRQVLALKHQSPFSLPHTQARVTFTDLHPANSGGADGDWISSYLRYDATSAYLVVTNGDPFNAHATTVHFTALEGQDSLGALASARIVDDGTAYRFTEVLGRPGWVPKDPNLPTATVPGWALFRPSTVPSGLYLDSLPPSTTYVFKIEKAVQLP